MSDTKFTPGPWAWGNEDWSDQWFLQPGVLIIDYDGGGPSGSDEFDAANAHLIAAAPDLYAALNGLLGLLDAGSLYEPQAYAARAALAKARGEA